jgi:hypothetical protein
MWFDENFAPAVWKHLHRKGLEEKALLLINFPVRHDAEKLIQPLDGDIIANVKRRHS